MIEIKINDKGVTDLLMQLQTRAKNMSPAMRKAAGIMKDAVEENFKEEGRPRWKPLARATLEQGVKTYKGNSKFGHKGTITRKSAENLMNRKILQKSGQLAASTSSKYDGESASVGTNKVYAAIHQFGGKAGKGIR